MSGRWSETGAGPSSGWPAWCYQSRWWWHLELLFFIGSGRRREGLSTTVQPRQTNRHWTWLWTMIHTVTMGGKWMSVVNASGNEKYKLHKGWLSFYVDGSTVSHLLDNLWILFLSLKDTLCNISHLVFMLCVAGMVKEAKIANWPWSHQGLMYWKINIF